MPRRRPPLRLAAQVGTRPALGEVPFGALPVGPTGGRFPRTDGRTMMEFLALLATAALFGGMILYSFGFAPLVFRSFPAEEAGRFIRLAFPWYYLFVIACAALAGALLGVRDLAAALTMTAVALVGVGARQGLMPAIDAARGGRAAGEPAATRRFRRLHGVSVLLNFAQLGATAWVLHRFL